MIRNSLKAALIIGAVQLFGASLVHAAPEGYEEFMTRQETMKIGDQKVKVPVTVWLRTRFVTNAAYFDLWADVDLSGFQAKAPKIAGRMSRHKTCGDRVRVKGVSLEPDEDHAQLCIRVRHERWQCLQAALPRLSGFGLSFKKSTLVKTRLLSQNAHVCATMWPVIADDGHEVRLEGQVTKNSVSGQSGLFGNMFNASGKFRSRLHSQINQAMANFKMPVPDALHSFDPVVDDAQFRTREDGSLGMALKMHVKVTGSELPHILALLSSD